ncbi:MAG TPA: prepilin-type N-terminal cleavage/methylation domain-containing protein [Chthoniobacteraceae bacterium]|jgi:prepilin-type N-terminal cleavage/methylation domain-containing protein|nr:hypothetical protein [Chthoniobacter sp.]HEV7868875.1 prepilin-type N-terminal cleavage/methylation domain-containing protein [Chthoniobacteraceae bacterium]
MFSSIRRSPFAFTLVEIMIVIAIIAMLAAIAVPNILRARKRSQATRMLNDLRVLDYALDRWAIEKNKGKGDVATFEDLKPFFKESSVIATTGRDLFGQEIGSLVVDENPKVSAVAFAALSDVAPSSFWSPYY